MARTLASEGRRIPRIGRLGTGRRVVACRHRRRWLDEAIVRFPAFRFGPAHLEISRRRRTWRPVRVALPIRVHDPEVMFGMLVQIFGCYPVAAGRCFARQRNIAFEDLIGVAADLYVWAIAVKSLGPLGHSRTVVV